MKTCLFAVQTITDGEDQKADLFKTTREVIVFCQKLREDNVSYIVYRLEVIDLRGSHTTDEEK